MESINNATSAVKTAIWGEGQNTTTTNTSGDQNYSTNTTYGDSSSNNNDEYTPKTTSNDNDSNYNRDTTTSSTSHESQPTHTGHGIRETHKSMIDDSITESREYSGRTESDPMAEGSYNPDDRDVQNTVSGGGQNPGSGGANFTNIQNTNDKSMSNSNEPNTGFGGSGAQPSVTADPSSGQKPAQKQQGADRPLDEPDSESTGSGEGHSGQHSGGSGGGASGGSMGGIGGGMKPPESHSTEKGDGTKYVKTSGLAADGGDFDATKPGAAKEADRLMEEKGIKHGEANPHGDSGADETDTKKKWYGVDHSGFGGHGSHSNEKPTSLSNVSAETDTTTEPTEKKGFGEKIKEKLHHSG